LKITDHKIFSSMSDILHSVFLTLSTEPEITVNTREVSYVSQYMIYLLAKANIFLCL